MKKISNIMKMSLLILLTSGCALENNYVNSQDSSLTNNNIISSSILENSSLTNSLSEEMSSSSNVIASNHYKGDYYDNANLTLVDSALKLELRELITETHTYNVSYGELRYSEKGLARSDASLVDSSKFVSFYSHVEISSTWDNGTTWNREHVLPQSEGWWGKASNSDRNAGSDIHHVRAEDSSLNSARGDLPFGEVTGGTESKMKASSSSGCYQNASYFEPIDEAKGDVARILFYMFTRYTETDDKSVTCVASSWEMLLEWNELDPVDELEMQRNDVGEKVQGNRNPFIDYPELANSIWG